MFCRSKPWLAAAAMLVACGAAWATDDGNEGSSVELGVPIPQQALAEHRGRESRFEFNFQETKATMEDTVAIGSRNGSNHIEGGAFGGASGFPVAVQNSGNNVIVQNAFIINLDVR